MWFVEITHNFETAHRLSAPGSPTKCMSIHGHSWWVKAVLAGESLDERDMLVEFGAFKSAWRRWLDDEVDHHLVLAASDPMAAAVRSVEPASRLWLLSRSPTTEVIAEEIGRRTSSLLVSLGVSDRVRVESIHLQETRVNAVVWRPS